MLITERPANR